MKCWRKRSWIPFVMLPKLWLKTKSSNSQNILNPRAFTFQFPSQRIPQCIPRPENSKEDTCGGSWSIREEKQQTNQSNFELQEVAALNSVFGHFGKHALNDKIDKIMCLRSKIASALFILTLSTWTWSTFMFPHKIQANML